MNDKKMVPLDKYLNNLGNVSEACRELGVSRSTIDRWRRGRPVSRPWVMLLEAKGIKP